MGLRHLERPPDASEPAATALPWISVSQHDAGRIAGTATVDAEDLREGDVEDEAQPSSNGPASPQRGTLAAIPSVAPIVPLASLPVPLPGRIQ